LKTGGNMKDIFLLTETLKHEIAANTPEEAFRIVIKAITSFYMENLYLDDDEVAILLIDKDRTVLSFCQPDYLIDSGMIPISSNESIASEIFKKGSDYLENNFQQQKHLNIFETIKTPDNEIKPVWKMIASVLEADDEKIGVIELSRRSILRKTAGEDFTQEDLNFLRDSQRKLGPLLKQVLPENYRGRFG
jgi:hypothetical protein